MEESKIREMLKNFHNDPNVQKLLSRYQRKSVSEIYGVARRELSHSSFLAWLFNSQADHGLGALACNKLMIMLASREDVNYPVLNKFLVGQQMLRNEVTKECVIDKGRHKGRHKGRPDIIIIDKDNKDNNIRLIIECKVGAKETTKQTEPNYQTEQYYKDYGKEKDGLTNIYVYLTPNGANSPKCKEFIHINYQDIINDILNPILKDENLSPRTRFIIDDYILALEKPADEFNEEGKITKNNIIMGTSKEMNEMLIKFWDEHQNLIINAVDALADAEPKNNELKELKTKMEEVTKERKNKTNLYIKCNDRVFYEYEAKKTLVNFAEYLYNEYRDKWSNICVEGISKHNEKYHTQIGETELYIKTETSTNEKSKLAEKLAKACGVYAEFRIIPKSEWQTTSNQ